MRALKLAILIVAVSALIIPETAETKQSDGDSQNKPPLIRSFSSSATTITLPCPPDQISSSGSCPRRQSTSITLATNATDPDSDKLLITYTVTGGWIRGEGSSVTWELNGVVPGSYTASVKVDDGRGAVSIRSTTVTIALCSDCVPTCVLCPQVAVTCPEEVEAQQSATFTASFTQGTPAVTETYKWTVTAGTITSGQGTSSITVDTVGLGGASITATVEVGGIDPACNRSASCTVAVRPPMTECPFDSYGDIRFYDEQARLDNFAVHLLNTPSYRAAIIAHGSCQGEALSRGNRAKTYLVNKRGIEGSRMDVVDGGCRAELSVVLWIVPPGGTAPAPDTSDAVTPCPICKKSSRSVRGSK